MHHGSNPARTARLARALLGPAALAASTFLLGGCGEGLGPEEESMRAAALAAGAGEAFDDGDVSDWRRFVGGGATLEHRISSSRATTGGTSMKMTYAVPSGGYAGVERRFSPGGAWSTSTGLTLAIYGFATGHTFRVQIYDAGNERWEHRFTVSFNGWQQISVPFGAFQRASYQPSSAVRNGVLDLAGVAGMALIPSDGKGSGYVYLDSIALVGSGGSSVPISSSDAGATIIPLYSSPSSGHWNAVIAAKKAHPRVPIMAVVNPHNGPGSVVSTSYSNGIAQLVGAGIKVIGYVWTSYGARSASEVQTDINRWRSFYPAVSGIFFDEMEHHGGHESYYSGLTAYAKARGFDFTIGNPGADSTPSYVGTVDVIFIYETSGLPTSARLGGWHASHHKRNFGIIPYGVSMSRTFVAAARQQVGYIYLQNDTLPNPWDTVPPYLGELVTALE